jgi:hypothetical protein
VRLTGAGAGEQQLIAECQQAGVDQVPHPDPTTVEEVVAATVLLTRG